MNGVGFLAMIPPSADWSCQVDQANCSHSLPARSVANGEEATKKLKEEGLTATYLQADLTDAPSFAAVKEKLVKDHGGLDIFINNAGIAFKVWFDKMWVKS